MGLYKSRYADIWVKRAKNYNLISEWSREHNALFVHVPKAAGSSVKMSLGETEETKPLPHCPALALQRIDPDFYQGAFVFAFIRNPWDKLVSAYHFIRDKDTPYNQRIRQSDLDDTPDFNAFLSKLRSPLFSARMMTRMHFMPQHFFLSDTHNNLIVDYVGRMETIADDFAHISDRIALSVPLLRMNTRASQRRDFRSYYDMTWKVETVNRMYRMDIEMFGYTFE